LSKIDILKIYVRVRPLTNLLQIWAEENLVTVDTRLWKLSLKFKKMHSSKQITYWYNFSKLLSPESI
jgi:hypothetical protein